MREIVRHHAADRSYLEEAARLIERGRAQRQASVRQAGAAQAAPTLEFRTIQLNLAKR